jgi:putative hydrolase of the HAD superfamily
MGLLEGKVTAITGGATGDHWLLCDYGNVLSLPQPTEDLERLAELTGVNGGVFAERYWSDREAYDRAELDAARYWSRLTGTTLDEGRLQALVAADIASWTHLNSATLAAAGRAEARGYRLAVLSNAPIEVARAVEQLDELAPFRPRWFSCDLQATKPDPAIYAQVLADLGGAAGSVTFLDDRPDNVVGARAVGLHAVVFEDPAQIDDL